MKPLIRSISTKTQIFNIILFGLLGVFSSTPASELVATVKKGSFFTSQKTKKLYGPAYVRSNVIQWTPQLKNQGSLKNSFRMGDKLSLEPFPGITIEAFKTSVKTLASGSVYWSGKSGKAKGSIQSDVSLFISNQGLRGTIYRENTTYLLSTLPDGSINVHEINSSLLEDECSIDHSSGDPILPEPYTPQAPYSPLREKSLNSPAVALVDILILYTQEVRDQFASNAAMDDEINFRIAEANEIFANSLVDVEFRLAHHQVINSLANTVSTGSEVKNDPTAQSLRDQYGADLVSFWNTAGGAGSGNLYSGNTSQAFNQCRLDKVQSSFTFVHECGHNLGAKHDRWEYVDAGRADELSPDLYLYGYFFTYNNGGEKSARTVMSYNNCPTGSCPRIKYFSNPELDYYGSALGVPLGNQDPDPAKNAAYNALRINDVALDVSTFRESIISSTYALSVTAVGGSVTLSPDKAEYNKDEVVNITATPDNGLQFSGWSGDLSGSTNPRSLVMSSDKNITANFSLLPNVTEFSTTVQDDAEENISTGAVNITSSDIELPRDGTTEQIVALRFSGVNIPKNATILSAHIQFAVDEADAGAVTVEIFGEDANNSGVLSTATNNISNRTKTSAKVNWSPSDWSQLNNVGNGQKTPDLSGIIQEIVNRSNWSNSNAMSIIIQRASTDNQTNSRTAVAKDKGVQLEAKLNVFYSYSAPTTQASLQSGWNIISFNATPDDPAVESVFASVTDLTLVKNNSGQVYWPSLNINSIVSITDGEALRVHTTGSANVTFSGTPINTSTPLNLSSGWNLIAYFPSSAMSVETALAGIASNINLVKNNSGEVYWPSLNINNIGNMVPGQGYSIHMTNSDVLTYPGKVAKSAQAIFNNQPKPANTHFIFKGNTGENATILASSIMIQGSLAPDGSEIGAFDSMGNLIGAGVIVDGKSAFSFWGDDITTSGKDGALKNEDVKLKLWAFEQEYPLEPVSQKPLTYLSDTIITGEFSASELLTLEDIRKVNLTLTALYPQLTVNINIPANLGTAPHDVHIELLDLNGLLVGSLERRLSPGQNELRLKFTEEVTPPGVYLLRVMSKNFKVQRKIIKIRN